MMNFNISIVAYVVQTTWPKTYKPALNNEAYVLGKSIFKNINIGCVGSYFVI